MTNKVIEELVWRNIANDKQLDLDKANAKIKELKTKIRVLELTYNRERKEASEMRQKIFDIQQILQQDCECPNCTDGW